MERVLDRLWIGSSRDLVPGLRALGFTAVLDLRDGVHPFHYDGEVKAIDQRDGDPWKREQIYAALEFIASQIHRGKVLVVCAAGMSRSASMVIGYLVRYGMSAPEAFHCVREARGVIAPVPKMLDAVLRAVETVS